MGHELPRRGGQHRGRCTPDSCRLAASRESVESGKSGLCAPSVSCRLAADATPSAPRTRSKPPCRGATASRMSLSAKRVGEDVSTLTPHRPGRAAFPASGSSQESFAGGWVAMDYLSLGERESEKVERRPMAILPGGSQSLWIATTGFNSFDYRTPFPHRRISAAWVRSGGMNQASGTIC